MLTLVFPVFAQEAVTVLALTVGSLGLFDDDGSVLYSVLLQSGVDELGDLTISSQLPENATFMDMFWTPESASFVGEAEGSVTWTLGSLPANTIIGPFTYRVTFEDAETIPSRAPAAVTWSSGEASTEMDDSELQALAPSGGIIVDEAGTDGLVAVEDTGVYL
jgi:hypothetical protein